MADARTELQPSLLALPALPSFALAATPANSERVQESVSAVLRTTGILVRQSRALR
jgi:hypothetical protein